MYEFNPKVYLNSFWIEGREYRVLPNLFDTYVATFPATLVSRENIEFPEGTVRFIGGAPWQVKRVYLSSGRVSNLFATGRFKPLYSVEWEQVGEFKMKGEELVGVICSSIRGSL